MNELSERLPSGSSLNKRTAWLLADEAWDLNKGAEGQEATVSTARERWLRLLDPIPVQPRDRAPPAVDRTIPVRHLLCHSVLKTGNWLLSVSTSVAALSLVVAVMTGKET